MSEPATLSSAPQEITEDDLGLEANDLPEASYDAAPSEEEIAQEAQDQLEDDDGGDDNLARLERLQTRQSSRAAAAAGAAAEAEGAEASAEGEDVEEVEEGVEEEAEGAEGGEPEEGIDPAQAQAYLDHLLETFGDQLVVPFKANGEERRATLKEIREQIAPGYMGQDGVDRTFKEATRQREAATATLEEANKIVEDAREEIRGYAKDPNALVDRVLYPLGGVDALRALRDHLDTTLEGIERDPNGFAMRHELRSELAGLRTEIASLKSGGQAAAAEPTEAKAAESEIPPDLGFIPGKGYPKAYLNLASATLERASKAAGVEFDAVLDAWDAGGRKDDPFTVLEGLTAAARRDTPKVKLAKQPPMKPRPKGGSSSGRTTPVARKTSGWAAIEGNLARAIEQANRG